MNGPDVMIQTEGNHEMDKLGTKQHWGLTGDLVDFIILSGFQPEFQTEKAEVFTEKIDECYRVGTELHMELRRSQEEEILHGKLL
jgi:hypothetical protein